MGLDNNGVTSLLSMLEEPDEQIRIQALKALLDVVDSHWAVVSESLSKLESLAEDDKFPARDTASALASKCYFHLEEYDDATRLALQAGDYFDVEGSSAYSKAIVGRCLETYVSLRGGVAVAADEEKKDLDPRLDRVVERMFSNCYATKNFKRAIGMALEAKRLDKVREAIKLSSPRESKMMSYTLENLSTQPSKFRQEVMSTLIDLYAESDESTVSYLEWFTCLHALLRVEDFASLLIKLVCSSNQDRALVAFQAAFDLVEFQDQRFERALEEAIASSPLMPVELVEPVKSSVATLKAILFEGKKAALLLDFMYKRNGSDRLLLRKFKEAADSGRKNSVLHHAMIVSHGYSQCGTTADGFLRDNLDWLARAANWAKFGATASLGVVHKGNVEPAMTLLQPYLPAADGNPRSSPYSEGGALYALGLIHSAEGVAPSAKKRALEYFSTTLDVASAQQTETVRESLLHGSCLGMGLVAMESSDATLIERLRNVLYTDSAVVGEAASLGMGLIMLGGGSKHAAELEELLNHAHDTKHEKIVRGISLSAALAYYGQEDQADALIEQLCRDKDHLLRYGGAFTIGAAYVGTANNAAVRRLLHIAVSDVSNDVRRAAVICLGLVMVRLPERLPDLIALLSESYNPHVRYGAAIALGIGCSSQADPKAALDLLEPLLDDKTDFVRQGAMIGTAFLLAQVRPEVDARAKRFREKLFTVVSDNKQASTMTRMGALLAAGIVDAGGRNAFLSVIGRNGMPKPPAVAGFILWVQYWFWYPLMHMLSLALSPSTLIGVNADLDLPKAFQVDCAGGDVARRFGMPEPTEEKKEEVKARVKTAVLSTTAKVSQRQKQKGQAAGVPGAGTPPAAGAPESAAPTGTAPAPEGWEKKKVEDKELLTNPIRVTKAMASLVRYRPGERYVPACEGDQHVGVMVLRDTQPGEEQDVVKVVVPPTGDVDPNEPAPPEPFEWTPPAE